MTHYEVHYIGCLLLGMVAGIVGGAWVGLKKPSWLIDHPINAIDTLDLTKSSAPRMITKDLMYWPLPDGHEPKAEEMEYAVTGTPRHIPWSRRKKELEASARQKRRQLESFREEV